MRGASDVASFEDWARCGTHECIQGACGCAYGRYGPCCAGRGDLGLLLTEGLELQVALLLCCQRRSHGPWLLPCRCDKHSGCGGGRHRGRRNTC
jgi:hypothetical protein